MVNNSFFFWNLFLDSLFLEYFCCCWCFVLNRPKQQDCYEYFITILSSASVSSFQIIIRNHHHHLYYTQHDCFIYYSIEYFFPVVILSSFIWFDLFICDLFELSSFFYSILFSFIEFFLLIFLCSFRFHVVNQIINIAFLGVHSHKIVDFICVFIHTYIYFYYYFFISYN